MGYRMATLYDEAQVELASKLPRGRFFTGGRAFMPFIKPALYEKVRDLPELTRTAAASMAAIGSPAASGRKTHVREEPIQTFTTESWSRPPRATAMRCAVLVAVTIYGHLRPILGSQRWRGWMPASLSS
jgi:hypothetical protein